MRSERSVDRLEAANFVVMRACGSPGPAASCPHLGGARCRGTRGLLRSPGRTLPGARGLCPKMDAPFVFDYLARLIIAPSPSALSLPRALFLLGAGLFCVAPRRPLRAGRGRRVSRFRWLLQNAAAPMRKVPRRPPIVKTRERETGSRQTRYLVGSDRAKTFAPDHATISGPQGPSLAVVVGIFIRRPLECIVADGLVFPAVVRRSLGFGRQRRGKGHAFRTGSTRPCATSESKSGSRAQKLDLANLMAAIHVRGPSSTSITPIAPIVEVRSVAERSRSPFGELNMTLTRTSMPRWSDGNPT